MSWREDIAAWTARGSLVAYIDDLAGAVVEQEDALAAAEADRDAQRTRAEAAEAEVARLRRQMETAPPWDVSDPPTDEEMRALRMRWAFVPEKYQADADALIAAVMHGGEEVARLRAIVEGRTVPPTEAEAAAHNAALGWWLISREGVCPPAAVDAFRGDGDVTAYLPMARGATWLPLDHEGRPTAWPVPA